MSLSTKAVQGLAVGMKFSLSYALFYAPFESKWESMYSKSNRIVSYCKSCTRASLFFCGLFSGVFAMSQIVS